MTYLQLLARQQILIKDGLVFESMRKIDTLVFDKTGTLTQEQPTVGRIHALDGFTEREILRLAAAAEYRQPHPIARAIIAHAEAENINPPILEEASYEVGFGIKVHVEEKTVRRAVRVSATGNVAFFPAVDAIQQQAEADSHSLVYIGVDDQPTIRPEAKQVAGITTTKPDDLPYLGRPAAPRAVWPTNWALSIILLNLPETKADLLQQLRDEGRFVGFVGDGINDAIARRQRGYHLPERLQRGDGYRTDHLMDGTLQHLLPLFELMDSLKPCGARPSSALPRAR